MEASHPQIAVAASFTADPVAGVLRFWLDELGLDAAVALAPYDQVFQELLDPASLLARNEAGLDVLLMRLADWGADTARAAGELATAVKAAAARGRVPYLLCLCPSPPGASSAASEAAIVSALSGAPGVEVVTAAALDALYPVAEPHDTRSDALGRIPYTPAFFAALGTLIARRYQALAAPPCKVIAVDCDGRARWTARGRIGDECVAALLFYAQRTAVSEVVERQFDGVACAVGQGHR